MVQKINPHPAPGCNRSPPPYYVFSKDANLGSVPSISSEVLDLTNFSIYHRIAACAINLIITACVACKNPVQTRKIIQFIKLENVKHQVQIDRRIRQ